MVIVPEGSARTRSIRIGRRTLRLAAAAAVLTLVAISALLATWAPLARRAAQVGPLLATVDSLELEQRRLATLATRLQQVEDRYEELRLFFGTRPDTTPPIWGAVRSTPAIDAAPQASTPSLWPLSIAGFVTQELLEGADVDHPGIDIAAPTDTYIRAAGSGQVVAADEDDVYGRYVRIDHGQGYQTLYGHASMLFVEIGRTVRAGEVIALSGSTGRSTAPHLHFEVSMNGDPVDPLALVARP